MFNIFLKYGHDGILINDIQYFYKSDFDLYQKNDTEHTTIFKYLFKLLS